MTREEAIVVLRELMKNPLFSEEHKVAFNIAINDIKQRHDWDINNLILINKENYDSLEQEPTQMIDKSNFSQEQYKTDLQSAYDCGKSVFDKIRDEIKKMTPTYHNKDWSITDLVPISKVLDVIDKYKAESEDKECK